MRYWCFIACWVWATASGCFSPQVTCSEEGLCPEGELCRVAERVCQPADECLTCSRPFALATQSVSQAANPIDQFGVAVATAGATISVGAFGDDGDSGGAVYVYERQGATWSVVQKQVAPDPSPGNQYGFAVAAATDVMAVGAPLADLVDIADTGSVYLYERISGQWQLALTIPGTATGDQMGCAAAIRGPVLVASACGADLGLLDSGAISIYEKGNVEWTLSATLTGIGVLTGDAFGASLAAGDNFIAVGAPGDSVNGDSAGAVYLFEKLPNGDWAQTAKLVARDGRPQDQFGHAVAADGSTLVVGAHGNGAGATYLFERLGSDWPQIAKLTARGGQAGDEFGFAVALAGDALAIGARGDDDLGQDSGSAYIFERQNDQWLQFARILAAGSQSGDRLGHAVAVEAGRLVTTAYAGAVEASSGSLYIFERAAQ